jgi:acetyl/propionyl-CoA carboxylase alpha subunit
VQRRHQKLIEESPSPAVDAELRARLAAASIGVADASDYEGAGTVEYLLSPEGEFFFLEVNARLQVEHPVTEQVTGVDLVIEQFRIAAGEPISEVALAAAREGLRGHAIEARIYAEVAAGGGVFLPSTGRVVAMRSPEGPGIRFDGGVVEGSEVSHHYDPMLAKVIAWGENREQARRRMLNALRELTIVGVETCQPFHLSVMDLPAFAAGDLDTNFLTRPEAQSALENPLDPAAAAIAAGLAHLRRSANGHGNGNGGNGNGNGRSGWGIDALRRGLRHGGRL